MNGKEKDVLKRAREVYGNKNQILVCMEELNELACVLAKFPRYEDEREARSELYESALDEVADVTVILEHAKRIFEFTEKEVDARVRKKIDRLERWLNTSSSMHQTTVDRDIREKTEQSIPDCKDCINFINPDYSICSACEKAAATEGIKPFYKKG